MIFICISIFNRLYFVINIAIEFVGPAYRTTCILLTNIAHSVGMVILSLVLYAFRDWRQLALATSLPFTVYFLYWW